MALNITKSNSSPTTFSLYQTILDRPLNINGEAIDKVDDVKLLSVVFDSHLRFSSHVVSIIQKVRPYTYALFDPQTPQCQRCRTCDVLHHCHKTCASVCVSHSVPLYISGRHVQAGEGTKFVPENNLTKYRTL